MTLRGLPTKGNWGWVQVKDLLKSLELPTPVRVDKRPDSDVAVLTFRDSNEAVSWLAGLQMLDMIGQPRVSPTA